MKEEKETERKTSSVWVLTSISRRDFYSILTGSSPYCSKQRRIVSCVSSASGTKRLAIMPTTTTTATTGTVDQSSQKDNIIDLCTSVGEAFSKFGILLRDLDICNQRSLSSNDKDQQSSGWDEQCVAMFRQAVDTFATSLRDISTVVAEKRIRER